MRRAKTHLKKTKELQAEITAIDQDLRTAEREEAHLTHFIERFPDFEPFLGNSTFSHLVEQGARLEHIHGPHAETLSWLEPRIPNRLEADTGSASSWQNEVNQSWFVIVFTSDETEEAITVHMNQRTIESVAENLSPEVKQAGESIQATLNKSGAAAAPHYVFFLGHDGQDDTAAEDGLDSYTVKSNDVLYLVSNPSPTPPNAL